MKRSIAPHDLFMILLKWIFKSMRKVRDVNIPTRVRKKNGSKNSELNHDLPASIKNAKEVLNLRKRLSISTIRHETL